MAFCQHTEYGSQFLVKPKRHCLSWPRQSVNQDTWPVLTAWSECRGLVPLQEFMKNIAQVIAVGEEQYLFIVNWSKQWTAPRTFKGNELPWLHWVSQEKVPNVHGLNGALSLFTLKLALGLEPSVVLYHGTSLQGARGIFEKGFQVSTVHSCPRTYYKCDPPYTCCCKGMLGPGVYFAGLDKATSNCGRAAGDQGEPIGVLLQCSVVPRECKIVTPWSPEVCRCGCGSKFSDHLAHWYHGQLFNSIFLENGAGVKRFELCIRRPNFATALSYQQITWNDNREVVGKSGWFR